MTHAVQCHQRSYSLSHCQFICKCVCVLWCYTLQLMTFITSVSSPFALLMLLAVYCKFASEFILLALLLGCLLPLMTYTVNCHIAVLTLLIIWIIVIVVVVVVVTTLPQAALPSVVVVVFIIVGGSGNVMSTLFAAQLNYSTPLTSALCHIIELCSFICTRVQLLCSWQWYSGIFLLHHSWRCLTNERKAY